ncbi:hypothetical protein JJB98_29355 [Bradyrhizobium diazoefficiens]|nr:hypothetical protein JJB98_29355 [Bradyrhizobium diazoefficiens]
MRALSVDALPMIGIVPADDLVDEGAIRTEIFKILGAAHQKGMTDGILEMTMCAFDRSVLGAMPLLLRAGCDDFPCPSISY